MVDSLAITSAAPPVASPQTTRATASLDDDEHSDFAQALHAAHDGSRSSPAANTQPTPMVKALSIPPNSTSATETAAGLASTAPAGASSASSTAIVEAAPTEDEVAALAETAVPAKPAQANADSAGGTAPSAAPTDVPSKASLAATASTALRAIIPAADNPPAKADAVKPHGKRHSVAASDHVNPASPNPTSAAASSAVSAVSPFPATAPSPEARARGLEATAPVRLGGPLTQAAQMGISVTATVVATPAATDVPAPQDQLASDVVLASNTAPMPQETLQPKQNVAAGSAAPRGPNATGPLKISPTTRAAKDASSPVSNVAAGDTLASAKPSPGGKAEDIVPAPAAPALPFAASLSRLAVADITAPSGAQPLTPHATVHPSQSPIVVGTDLQASGALLQPAGETATRSSALEVGFHDANLGWLSIRASTDVTGGLHAAVGAKTSAALAAVDTMLPALDRFLRQENVAVHSVTAASSLAGAATASGTVSAPSFGQTGLDDTSSRQQGTGRDASQRNPNRNPGTASAQTERAASQLTSAGTAVRYSQGEQLSIVSVRI